VALSSAGRSTLGATHAVTISSMFQLRASVPKPLDIQPIVSKWLSMAYHSLVIQIFISSPSDVADDRALVKSAMDAWNQRNARDRGCFLTPLTWESIVSPDMASSSQEVINLEIGDDYDVFLGLMWARFGTPTGTANSGTEEEFERAVQRKNNGDGLRISFLFKNADVPLGDIDPDQLKKVKDFQNSAAQKGLLYRQYADQSELITALNIIFDKIAKEKGRYSNSNALSAVAAVPSEVVADTYEEMLGEQEGILDLDEKLEAAAASLAKNLQEWGSRFTTVNQTVRESTATLATVSQFGSPDKAVVRSAVAGVTGGLLEFNDFAQAKIEDVEDNLEDIMSSLSGLLDISEEINPNSREESLQQLAELKSVIGNTSIQLTSYIDALSRIPRIDTKFIKARNAVVAVHKRFLKKIDDFHARLERLEQG